MLLKEHIQIPDSVLHVFCDLCGKELEYDRDDGVKPKDFSDTFYHHHYKNASSTDDFIYHDKCLVKLLETTAKSVRTKLVKENSKMEQKPIIKIEEE